MKQSNLDDLLKLSRRAGERFDLVQAGGGNTSVKNEDSTMYVKASGLRLSDLKSEDSFVLIDNLKLQNLFREISWKGLSKRTRENFAGEIISKSNLTPDKRPSIETLLHSNLDGFILHSHPVSITSFFSNQEAKNLVAKHCPEFGFVPYQTPGIDLALAQIEGYNEYLLQFSQSPKGFVFQNHGLITYGKTWEEAFQETLKIHSSISKIIGFHNSNYDVSNLISEVMEKITGEYWLTIVSEDIKWNERSLSQRAFFPDAVVFLGVGILILEQLDKESVEKQIKEFLDFHSLVPKVFKFKENLYFLGKTFMKAKEIEEVWRLHHLASQFNPDALLEEEINYLTHWEAEKFRQKI